MTSERNQANVWTESCMEKAKSPNFSKDVDYKRSLNSILNIKKIETEKHFSEIANTLLNFFKLPKNFLEENNLSKWHFESAIIAKEPKCHYYNISLSSAVTIPILKKRLK